MENREIKFRAFDKFNDCYWYSDKHKGLGHFFTSMLQLRAAGNEITFEQFIGLRDKEGKDIYEGHWVFYDGDFYQVNFKSGTFGIDVLKTKGEKVERVLHSTQWIAHEKPEPHETTL